jgi:hypothetical protein
MDGSYFGQPEPWVRHLSSRVEFRWPVDGTLTAREDLRESPEGLFFDEEKPDQLAWPILSAGFPRRVMGMFVLRHDSLTGITYTRVERL